MQQQQQQQQQQHCFKWQQQPHLALHVSPHDVLHTKHTQHTQYPAAKGTETLVDLDFL
jgi:hypothetical protein